MSGCQALPAITLQPSDPNCIFYANFKEGFGTKVRDHSQSGVDVTLNGGPAWVTDKAWYSDWSSFGFQVPSSTSATYTPNQGNNLRFTATAGEDATTAVTTAFEFTGNKEFMIMFKWKLGQMPPIGIAAPILTWNQGGVCGFLVAYVAPGAASELRFGFSGIQDNTWSIAVTNNRSHSYGIWRNKSGIIDLYYDGDLARSFSGQLDSIVCVGGSELAFAKATVGAGGEVAGNLGAVQIWNAIEPRQKAQALFKEFHNLP